MDSAPPDVAQPPINEEQWTWLGTTLNTSTADWIIVVGHFPVLSAGENGPTPVLVDRLLPLLTSSGVRASALTGGGVSARASQRPSAAQARDDAAPRTAPYPARRGRRRCT